jgi:hypothetical protein
MEQLRGPSDSTAPAIPLEGSSATYASSDLSSSASLRSAEQLGSTSAASPTLAPSASTGSIPAAVEPVQTESKERGGENEAVATAVAAGTAVSAAAKAESTEPIEDEDWRKQFIGEHALFSLRSFH